jgi:TetR/AcrR family transcriptional repressor of nem operon
MALSVKALETQQRIINAAAELFYLHGYNASGLDRIIKTAGITKGNFYYHFKSKEALAIATLDWQFKGVEKDLAEQVFNQAVSPIQTLYLLLEFIANKQKSQHNDGYICGCYFGNFTLELSTVSQQIRDKVKYIFNQYLQVIESLLIQAHESKEIAEHIEPTAMSAIIMGQIEGAILLDKANQKPENVDNSISFIRQILTP